MPKKRETRNANKHNSQHENGIVAPGKPISKRRSNGQIISSGISNGINNGTNNGSSDGSRASTPPVPVPSPGPRAVSQPPATNDASPSSTKARSTSAAPRPNVVGGAVVGLVGDEVMMDRIASKAGESGWRKIDVNAAKTSSMHDGGILTLALTVLRSCPLQDTLAILIFLLSLPPTVLTLTNAAFAMSTFVPPSGAYTTLPTLSDFVSSFSPATPSFLVMMLIDTIAIGFWGWLPIYVQAMMLEWSQAVVATTLGGGFASKGGVSDNTPWMIIMVSLAHLSRYKRHLYDWSQKTPMRRWLPEIAFRETVPLSEVYPVGYERSWYDFINVLVTLHILCQGLTKMVRRRLHNTRTNVTPSNQTAKIPENEVAVGMSTALDVGEQSHQPAALRTKESLQNMRDVKDKVSSGKRRRKQANYVRTQQPLWAAFASTKATILREYEQSQATSDADGSGAKDAQNLGSAPFAKTDNRIWLTTIQPGGFFFETAPLHASKNIQPKDAEEIDGTIDKTKPFFVRINGADWTSVKIAEDPASKDKHGRLQYTGEVYGLSPAYSYQVSFVRCDDFLALHSESIATPAVSHSDQSESFLHI